MIPFSIVIATCGRPERLLRALDAVAAAAAAAGGAQEVVVVDNSPEPRAHGIVASWSASSGLAARCLRSRPRDKASALNAGVAAAGGEWLAFTDDDTLPDAGWLRAGAGYAQQSGARVFGGRIVPGPAEQPLPNWLQPGRSGRVPALGGVFVRYDPLPASGWLGADHPVPFGANVFVRRDVFREHGGYDETLWRLCGAAALGVEDGEFGVRLRRRGEPVGYCREALVVHPVHHERATLRSHARIAYWYGWRDPLVFFDPKRPKLERYRLRLLAGHALGAVRDLLSRDAAGAAWRLEQAAENWGAIAGRLSPAYRAWAARQGSGA